MAEKKTTTKRSTKVEAKCECGDNCSCKEGMLKNIFYCLVVANIILGMIFIAIVVKDSETTKSKSSSSEEVSSDYDTSMFDELTVDEAIAKIKKGGLELVYIGRSTCGYCVQFLPNLQKAQNEFGYKTIYLDLTKITAEDQAKLSEFGGVLKTYDESCVNPDDVTIENECGQFGFTPMMLIFENGKLKDKQVGYTDYEVFASLLKQNGF